MDTDNSKKFKDMSKIFDELAFQIQTLNISRKTASLNKNSILNQLILALHKFDDHFRKMVVEFPEYYQGRQDAINALLQANEVFLFSLHEQIRGLEKEN